MQTERCANFLKGHSANLRSCTRLCSSARQPRETCDYAELLNQAGTGASGGAYESQHNTRIGHSSGGSQCETRLRQESRPTPLRRVKQAH